MTQSERRLAAIMFTDLVGFSALTQKNEALALELLSTKRQLLTPLLEQHRGTLVKTMGDGFLVEFPSALGAVSCAISIQSMLHGFNKAQPQGRNIELRIGIHVGDVHYENDDIFGDGVNIASRIEPLAEPSGICITRNVCEYVDGKVEAKFESIGIPSLKNIQTPIEVFKIIPHWRNEGLQNNEQDHAPPVSISDKSVAVLPFDNLSEEKENEYFSDGLTEDILTKLSKVRELKVISRTSVMQYKGVKRNLKEIAKELGVATVVEGSVRKAGNQVRITAQLINAYTDEHLWADSYDRELDNIFAVQSEVAEAIVDALQANITPEEREQLTSNQTKNTEAYNHYLQGLHLWNQRTDASVRQAIQCFEAAITSDPKYALAYVGLADAYLILDNFNIKFGTDEIVKNASQAVEKALEIDPHLGEAYASLAQIKRQDFDWTGAETLFKKAIKLNPNYATAHHWYGNILSEMQQHKMAMQELKKALELDPLSLIIQANIGLDLMFQKSYQEGEQYMRAVYERFPESNLAKLYLAFTFVVTSKFDEALSLLEHMQNSQNRSNSDIVNFTIALAYTAQGDNMRAYDILTDLLEAQMDRPVTPVGIGFIYAALGKNEKALNYMWKGYEQRDRFLSYAKVHFAFDPLRHEPRFKELIEKLGLGD